MKKTYRAHPLMILMLLKPFLFVLIIPVLKGVVQYIISRRISGIISLEVLAFSVILAIAALKCRAFRLTVSGDVLTVKSGLFFVRKAVINISRLSSVQTLKDPIDTLFGSVTYRINTEAGAKGKADFEFKLKTADSEELSRLLYGEKAQTTLKFPVWKLAVMAATTSSALSGIIFSVPIINKTGKLLGVALSSMLFDEINTVSEQVETFFPPVVNAATLIFLLGYAVAFIRSFIKFINFRIFLKDDKLEIRSGFIVRRRTEFRKKSVNDVRIEQTAIMRMINRFSMKVSVGGYEDSKNEEAILVPCGRHGNIKRQFSLYFPFLAQDGRIIHAKRGKKTRSRFLYLPVLYTVITVLVCAALILLFPYFERLVLFLGAVALAVIAYYADLCLYNYRFGKIKLGTENVFAQSSKLMRTCELCCSKDKIGQIKLIRYKADIRNNTCKVVITIRSESADSIRVRHLDYDTVKSEIFGCFGIKQ